MAYSVKSKDCINYEPNQLNQFHLYSYEYIDNLTFLRSPAKVLGSKEKAETYIAVFKEVLQKNTDWEGDGRVKLMWLPPFCIEEDDFKPEKDWEGVIVWFIKQKNDGISWMLSPKKLSLKNGF